MCKRLAIAAAVLLSSACRETSPDQAPGNEAAETPTAPTTELTLARLDCGTGMVKDFDAFFSDRPGLYPPGPREITDSCYLIRQGDQQMVWDTGFASALKGKTTDLGGFTVQLDRTIAEQLSAAGLRPADIDVVGISHMHGDHVGQAAEFPNARLVIGKADFEQSAGEQDPFGPWREDNGRVTAVSRDLDIFGDGSVMALHLPGHTPDHLALLVNLPSGPVLLSGDLYHSAMAREKRGVPPFNTDRAQTLQSMDRFEQVARETGAKVIIQHEPADIDKLPALPRAAQQPAVILNVFQGPF